MIKENQQLLNRLNILSDGLIIFLMIPVSFWLRYQVLPNASVNMSLRSYLTIGFFYTLVQLVLFFAVGVYRPFRHARLRRKLGEMLLAFGLGLILLLSYLSVRHLDNYSRQMIFLWFGLSFLLLGAKRVILIRLMWHFRGRGYNLKHVVLVGSGAMAERYLDKIQTEVSMGYHPLGYISEQEADLGIPWLGGFEKLEEVLEREKPDEVISAVESQEFDRTPLIIAACEKTGCKLSAIPIYAAYMSARPQIDDLDGIPLLNMRRIPLDNLANAFIKRLGDIVCSALILVVSSPLMLLCAIGVKLSSPGPVIFAQERVGLNKKTFLMYKFRSMRLNPDQDTAWSTQTDSRKTRFGTFIRKYSLDEFPQFWNVLKGDMSMVGPRPEIPYYVDQFKEEIPRYMLKHLVRPGITGWAQVNGFRGDTSISERIRYDIDYIEHWSLGFDLRILFRTVFGGKFKNDEQ